LHFFDVLVICISIFFKFRLFSVDYAKSYAKISGEKLFLIVKKPNSRVGCAPHTTIDWLIKQGDLQ